jgi:hypothetical protein
MATPGCGGAREHSVGTGPDSCIIRAGAGSGSNDTLLIDLNTNPLYTAPNLFDTFPNQINNDPNSTIPDFHPNLHSSFYDIPSFNQKIASSQHPILASINCQSLQAKHHGIQNLLTDSSSSTNHISILALQETWRINHPSTLNIQNYSFIHKDRSPNQGGGVGFYIRAGLAYNVMDDLSTFIPKTFECITIETVIHGKKMYISSVYTVDPQQSPLVKLLYNIYLISLYTSIHYSHPYHP